MSSKDVAHPEKKNQNDALNESKEISIHDVVESMDPPFRDAYKDPSEIQNYRQDGFAQNW